MIRCCRDVARYVSTDLNEKTPLFVEQRSFSFIIKIITIPQPVS